MDKKMSAHEKVATYLIGVKQHHLDEIGKIDEVLNLINSRKLQPCEHDVQNTIVEPPKPEPEKTINGDTWCPSCHNKFEKRRKDQVCCSFDCRDKYNKQLKQDEKLAKIRKENPVKRNAPKIDRQL